MLPMLRPRLVLSCAMLAAFLLVPAGPARGDGFIVVNDPPTNPTPGHFAFAPLNVTYHRVTVDINDHVATTSVDQEFHNPNARQLEGTYLFPLPPGAHIDKFEMDVNGTMTRAELLDAGKARGIYEEIVRKYRDPALLEYAGRDAFKARIFPIEPNSRKRVKISYTQVLKGDTGTVEYTYPLNTEKFSARPLEQVSVKVSLACKQPIKSLYSPSHDVEIRREGEAKATVGYEERNVRPDTDFKLIFSRGTSPVGVDLLTYRNAPDEGYFLLLASPGIESSASAQLQKRDVCFVIDTSGSMAEAGGKKMEQAKRALSFCLQNLNDGDRFDVVRFSTEAETLFGRMTDVTPDARAKAQAFVDGLKPIGGTAIEDALKKALALRGGGGGAGPVASEFRAGDVVDIEWSGTWYPGRIVKQDGRQWFVKYDGYGDGSNVWVGAERLRRPPSQPAPASDRPYVIVFLTDGQPTIGETNEDVLVNAVNRSNPANTRIFSFGIGTDVNTHLLDRIAMETKAFSSYVLPNEDLEVKLSSFYTKISQPVLSNVQLAFTGADIKATQTYPNAMPDLFRGEMLIAFGRYTGKGPAAVKVSGTLNGERREFVTDVNFAEHDTARPFIPQLWATRRVGWLLDEIRRRGESTELKDEVTRLAREHGIVTPYTSYLIVEDERNRAVPLAMQTQRELAADAPAAAGAAAKYASVPAEAVDRSRRSGEAAVENSVDLADLKSSSNVAQARRQGERLVKVQAGQAQPGQQPMGYKAAQNYAQQARVVNGRAFYQNGVTWTDATAQTRKDLKQKQVAFNSDDYFVLLSNHPDAAQWLALGNEVDVVLGDTLYQIR